MTKNNPNSTASEIIKNLFEAVCGFVTAHWLFCLVIVIAALTYNWGFTYAYSDVEHLAKQGIEICLLTTLALTVFIILWTGILLGKIHTLKGYLPKKDLLRWITKNLAEDFMSNTRLGGCFWGVMMSVVSSILYTGIWWWILLAASGTIPNSFTMLIMYFVNVGFAFIILNCQISADELQALADEDPRFTTSTPSKRAKSVEEIFFMDEEDEFIYDESIEDEDVFEGDEPEVPMSERIQKFKADFEIGLEKFRVSVVSFLEEIFAFD